LLKGEVITQDAVEALRPCPKDALAPYNIGKVLNKTLIEDIEAGDYITWKSIE
jgi:sialic acid synthase SpsE